MSIDGAVSLFRDRLRAVPAERPTLSPEVLRSLRAIAALERIAATAAREVLEKLARGDPGAPETQEAAAALLRLSRKRP